MSDAGVAIVVRGLRKSVPGAGAVLQDVSFSVQPGELVGIAGGSGAGRCELQAPRGCVMRRAPRPCVAKLTDQRMKTSTRF